MLNSVLNSDIFLKTEELEKHTQKILIKNPIRQIEIDELINNILNNKNPAFLLIDYGDHDFESIKVIKYCREQLLKIESKLMEFQKIAIVAPQPYTHESINPEKIGYFHSKKNAINWLLN
ncbi:hypothetical protein [Xanthovirga aplysinae]|uniref:hypothetical protein n=1 Tax=Xanthovirga aplysinae TaxID=2529853 RepID=UPI0012BB6932|nr:hypothetical protein [Xanthovirga aplysinae]MTI31111.1 hypothetical protein [Xanthovirga aplysinae]